MSTSTGGFSFDEEEKKIQKSISILHRLLAVQQKSN